MTSARAYQLSRNWAICAAVTLAARFVLDIVQPDHGAVSDFTDLPLGVCAALGATRAVYFRGWAHGNRAAERTLQKPAEEKT